MEAILARIQTASTTRPLCTTSSQYTSRRTLGVHQLLPVCKRETLTNSKREKHKKYLTCPTWDTHHSGPKWRRNNVLMAVVDSSVAGVLLSPGKEGTWREEIDKDAEETILLDVEEMMCGACASSVKHMLVQHPAVSSAAVNLVTETAAVKVRRHSQTNGFRLDSELADLVTAGGFPCSVRQPGLADSIVSEKRIAMAAKREQAIRSSRVQVAIAVTLALICCGSHVGHVFHLFGLHGLAHGPIFSVLDNPFLKASVSMLALLGPARELVWDGLRALGRRAPNMNSLVGVGAWASFAISAVAVSYPDLGWDTAFFEEPVMLLAVVLLGRSLEAHARANAASDLHALFSLLPATCHLLIEESSEDDEDMGDGAVRGPSMADFFHDPSSSSSSISVEVPTCQVRTGDSVLVLPGETIPVDGVVTAGRSAVDESMLTGEALTVAKEAGCSVSAGTINWEGPIAVQTVATGANSAVSIITQMVEEAQSREAPVQRLVDRISGPFVFSVMGLSAATFLFWYFIGTAAYPDVLLSDMAGEDGSSLLLSLKLAIDVLVVACPCALGLATPTAVLVGTSMGATRGLLLRGGDSLERLASIDTVVLDKTGTLTQGKPTVTSIVHRSQPSKLLPKGAMVTPQTVLSWAASVESATKHPIAHAIIDAARLQGCQLDAIQSAVTVPGKGVVGSVRGLQVAVGERTWVEKICGSCAHSFLDPSEQRDVGQSTVYVGVESEGLVGCIQVSDRLREDAKDTVMHLHRCGLATYLMSGDDELAVTQMGESLGMEGRNLFGRLLPSDKAAKVLSLQQSGGCVAMVGDGVNDAPAMASADVGVALSHSQLALDAATDAASVVLMGNRLWQFVEALDLAKATMRRVHSNLAWALCYNAVTVPLAAGVLLPEYDISLTPSLSGGLMALSSIVVLANSILLRLHRSPSISRL